MNRMIRRMSALLLALSGMVASPAEGGTNSPYWASAQSVHEFVVRNLQSSAHGYRIQTNSSTAYEWYCASQIDADCAMVSNGDARYLPSLTNSYFWMNHLWDNRSPIGGYFAAASINGTNAGGGKYVDDNSLAGNVYLDCYAATTGPIKTQFLASAAATAHWLISSGQWDDTFGGGFWWDGTKQNKPTQSNGLVLQLFLRLYHITGQKIYHDWADSTRNWLETRMFNPADGLYVWQITTNGASTGLRNPAEFTYDNAIMIEADLLDYQILHAANYRIKAEKLAARLNAKLWHDREGVYAFNTTDGRVNPCWCGWASQSLIRLYQADGNTAWLNFAQRNIDYMNNHLRAPQSGGYFTFCNLDGSNVENRMEGVDQSWMQRIQALLSNYR